MCLLLFVLGANNFKLMKSIRHLNAQISHKLKFTLSYTQKTEHYCGFLMKPRYIRILMPIIRIIFYNPNIKMSILVCNLGYITINHGIYCAIVLISLSKPD